MSLIASSSHESKLKIICKLTTYVKKINTKYECTQITNLTEKILIVLFEYYYYVKN